MTVRPGKGVICMGQTGMTPYEFLYLLAVSWLLLWLALSVITLKFRLHQRERKGREQFRYEKLFFQNICSGEETIAKSYGGSGLGMAIADKKAPAAKLRAVLRRR